MLVRLLIKCPRQHFFSLASDYPETLLTGKYGLARVRSARTLPTEKNAVLRRTCSTADFNSAIPSAEYWVESQLTVDGLSPGFCRLSALLTCRNII